MIVATVTQNASVVTAPAWAACSPQAPRPGLPGADAVLLILLMEGNLLRSKSWS